MSATSTAHPISVHSPRAHSKSTAAICLVIKNETIYLDEWIDFHYALGFTSFFIYDNSPIPDNKLLKWYEGRKDLQRHVTISHEPSRPAQQVVYNRCLYEDAASVTFVGLFDVDEFLVLRHHDNVVDFMEEHCDEDCGQLSVNWLMMGTSGGIGYRPLPVTLRNVHSEAAPHTTVKTIVRPGYVADDGVKWVHTVDLKRGYWVDTNRKRHPQKPGWEDRYGRFSNKDRPGDVALLHHYKFKSSGELHYKKCVRGEDGSVQKS